MVKAHHLVLIYSRVDTEIMQRVRASLLAAGLMVWTDEQLEVGTSEWAHASENPMRSAGGCIVLLSPDSNGAAPIEQQLALARTHNVRIFPVIGRGDEWSAIPKLFIGTQIIDVRANPDVRMAVLIGRIKAHLGLGEKPPN